MFWIVVQSDNDVGESLWAINESPTSTASVKKSPATVTVYIHPFLIAALGLTSKSGVLVAALYPPWNITPPAVLASTYAFVAASWAAVGSLTPVSLFDPIGKSALGAPNTLKDISSACFLFCFALPVSLASKTINSSVDPTNVWVMSAKSGNCKLTFTVSVALTRISSPVLCVKVIVSPLPIPCVFEPSDIVNPVIGDIPLEAAVNLPCWSTVKLA